MAAGAMLPVDASAMGSLSRAAGFLLPELLTQHSAKPAGQQEWERALPMVLSSPGDVLGTANTLILES